MTDKNPHLFIFAGERSGDLHGKEIIEHYHEKHPSLTISGVAGPLMRELSITCIEPMESFQVMGISDILVHFPRLISLFFRVRNHILKAQPEAVVLIDYPGFNLLLAKSLRKRGYYGKIYQVVCPTVWAWRKGRKKIMEETLDHLFCLFPFETAHFEDSSLNTSYVGNPVVHKIQNYPYSKAIPKELQEKKILTIFPGSRKKELLRNLPIQLSAAKQFCEKHPEYTIALSLSSSSYKKIVEKITKSIRMELVIFSHDYNYEMMRRSHLSLATSGTINLELGLHKVPTVVSYVLSPIDYFLAKHLFKINLPHYCIVNIILNKRAFPECYAHEATTENLVTHLEHLSVEAKNQECVQHCEQLEKILGNEVAAKKIVETIGPLT